MDVCFDLKLKMVTQASATETHVLDTYSTDGNLAIRRAVAENPNTPKGTLLRMSLKLNPDVAYGLVGNPNATRLVKFLSKVAIRM